MDHPYLTKRAELMKMRASLRTCDDVMTLLKLTPTDRKQVAARRERAVADDAMREVLVRRSADLGCLVEDLGAGGEDAWCNFILGGDVDTSALQASVKSLSETLGTQIVDVDAVERDDGSSSYSDYSDSDTQSTCSGDESDGTGAGD